MSDLLAAAAAALGSPEAMVKRSAEARAKASGISVDQVLAAWAGGGMVEASAPPAPTVEVAPPPMAAAPALVATVAPAAAAAPPPPPVVAPPSNVGAPPRTVTTALPPPAQVSVNEAARYPVVVTVPTAGLTERTAGGMPRWLTAVSIVVAAFGLLYLAGNTQGGQCGEAGLLLVDRQTGVLENCDGSKFEGRGGPGAETDFLALGQGIFAGQEVAGVNCSGCHQPDGSGGAFPQLSGGAVLRTFSACTDHLQWVRLGSTGWPDATYGDSAKPKKGGMPAFGSTLSDEQLTAVVFFERVVFGGAPQEAAEADCGLAAPAEPIGATPGDTPTTSAPPG